MFWAERKDGKIEIVDGVQRINTLVHFVDDKIKLLNLKSLDKLEGFTFSDLGTWQQLHFNNRALRIILLATETTNQLRQDIFSRVNRSGQKANPSEFRRGTYPGKFTDFIDFCSKEKIFKQICPLNNKKELRYEGFELVLRFFAFTNKYLEFKHDVTPFLDDFLTEQQDKFDEDAYRVEFLAMCNFVERHFPNGFAKKGTRQVPHVRFEAISVGAALALRENPTLSNVSVNWLDGDEFKELTTADGSNNSNRLKNRVEFVRDKLLGKI